MSGAIEAGWKHLSEFVTPLMEAEKIPGVAVGMFHQGETTTAGFGVTHIEHPLPVTGETIFQIGSISKPFTATAIMRLVEMGKLDLDATVRKYLPAFKVADATAASLATIRHLLTHTGGWVGDFFHNTGPGEDSLFKYVADMSDLEQLAPVGTTFSYSNSGFILAGAVLEKVTGKRYETVIKELVFEPLSLKNAYLTPTEVMTYRFAVGHHNTAKGVQVARDWPLPRNAYPSGGIACHVKDLLRFACFYLGNGTKDGAQLLKPESVALMHSPQAAIWREREAVGLAWFIEAVNGARLISHGGQTNGQSAFLLLVPRHDFAAAILTNANNTRSMIEKVCAWFLKQYLGIERPDPRPVKSSEADLIPYVGRYSRPLADVELGILCGKLVGKIEFNPIEDTPPLPPLPPMTFGLCQKDRLLVLDGPLEGCKAEVIRGPDGSISRLRINGRLHLRTR